MSDGNTLDVLSIEEAIKSQIIFIAPYTTLSWRSSDGLCHCTEIFLVAGVGAHKRQRMARLFVGLA
jgi:hypothetical protein